MSKRFTVPPGGREGVPCARRVMRLQAPRTSRGSPSPLLPLGEKERMRGGMGGADSPGKIRHRNCEQEH